MLFCILSNFFLYLGMSKETNKAEKKATEKKVEEKKKYSPSEIKKAIANIKEAMRPNIVEHYKGYILMALTAEGLENKKKHIDAGDVYGFMTVEKGLTVQIKKKLQPKVKPVKKERKKKDSSK